MQMQLTHEEKSVLLVEDNEINQLIAMELLREAGVAVQLAENGREAVEHVQTNSYDMIFMDIQMPEMDGVEATKLIRQQHSQRQLPIVALTANVQEDEVTLYREVGMNDCLSKPYMPQHLHQAVSNYCH